MLNKEGIKNIIPQRDPFLMIDEVEEYVPGESAIAYKNVNEQEWYFKGHFPGNPIMPGVLIAESLAQTGAVAILSMDENKGKNALFGGIDKMKFKRKVVPGDRLKLEVKIEKLLHPKVKEKKYSIKYAGSYLENQKNKSEIDDDEYINGIYERDIWLKNHIQESSVDENER